MTGEEGLKRESFSAGVNLAALSHPRYIKELWAISGGGFG